MLYYHTAKDSKSVRKREPYKIRIFKEDIDKMKLGIVIYGAVSCKSMYLHKMA